MNEQLTIGISVGDTNGIGPEIVLKAIAHQMPDLDWRPVVFASESLMRLHAEACGVDTGLIHPITDIAQAQSGKCNVMSPWTSDPAYEAGAPTLQSGAAARRSLRAATKALLAGSTDALVTAPIDKHNTQSPDFDFPGHTEYLAHQAGNGATPLMFLVSDVLRVGVCTGHIPVSAVRGALSASLILKKIKLMNDSLKLDFGIARPRIALLGLNPHAGDNGLIGRAEVDLISPTIAVAKEKGYDVDGPHPADGLMGSGGHKEYDAVLAMYHDQGLIPFKVIAFENGVNFTAGLPFVRTSPDHGTAFDIAGKGNASAVSMIEAVRCAAAIVRQRAQGA